MTLMKAFVMPLCATVLSVIAFAQTSTPPRITANDAKNHIGESAIVCGKVVETKVPKYGLSGRGKPVSFFLDNPEATSTFYFIAFGAKPDAPQEAVAAYEGKQVCVTGQVNQTSGKTFIMAADRSQIRVDSAAK